MKKKTGMAAAALALVLVSSTAGQAFAAPGFKDLEGVKGAPSINTLLERGIVSGVSEGVFAPQQKLTGAQAATLITKGLNLNFDTIRFIRMPLASDNFTKIKDDAWYAQAFVYAHFYGIKFPDDIDPNKSLTREEFAYYLQQAIEHKGDYPLIKIYIRVADESEMNVEYQGAIQRSLIYKIATLDENDNFNPKKEITREEAAVMLYNAIEFVKDRDQAPPAEEPAPSEEPGTTSEPAATADPNPTSTPAATAVPGPTATPSTVPSPSAAPTSGS